MLIMNTVLNEQSNVPTNVSDADMPIVITPPSDDGIKIVESEYHTLFVCDEDPVLKEFVAVDEGEEYPALREIVPKHKRYTLYIESFASDKNQLHKILYELRKATEHDVLEIRISSYGGSVDEGITLYNAMREIFTGRTVTYNDSVGYSMGGMLFSLGDERVTYEDSSLMYHTFSTGYFGKGGEVQSYIDYSSKHFERFFKHKIVDEGFITNEEYEEMKIGKDFWMDSYEMAKRGISTHVIVSGYKLDNEAFIEYHDQDKSIDEWVIDKLQEIANEELAEVEEKEVKKKTPAKKKTSTKKKTPAKKKTSTKKKNTSKKKDDK